ncbi:type II toxin-antitoxin system Phd/YefM family antitoxin [Secundilactobacillus mixtipabuli]|uniref:Antitoxin n=1 Tax=Secundilactobacillus mixtipabuli TaxID=1435342 RepID=A0A1Z5ICU2_9LACO|nr:type II toxin-antitoxin system Phd/YefM family antitoxin [Secundilactobacillus mixtipabuli]GAW99467.1 prevent-host-death protein [Secundilactobacillus mixtipabuli]
MNAVNYSNFRKNLKDYIKKVNNDSESLIVTSKDPADTIVVMSKSNYDSMKETMYLLSNQKLMDRIRRGDEQFAAGKSYVHELLDDDQ